MNYPIKLQSKTKRTFLQFQIRYLLPECAGSRKVLCRQYTLQVSRTKHTPRECTRAHVRAGYDLRAFDFAPLVPEDGGLQNGWAWGQG